MTFKQFMTTVGYLPATALSGLTNLVLGSTKKEEDEIVFDEDDEPKVNRGILGYALDGIKYVARSFADFIAEHKKAIAIAFWASLAVAGAAALTVALWPAALTAVTTFTVFGLSIAGVVGANTLLQIGAVAALAFAATSVATYVGATLANAFTAIRDFVKSRRSSQEHNDESSNEENYDLDADEQSSTLLSRLNTGNSKTVISNPESVPVHTPEVIKKSSNKTPVIEDLSTTSTLSLSKS